MRFIALLCTGLSLALLGAACTPATGTQPPPTSTAAPVSGAPTATPLPRTAPPSSPQADADVLHVRAVRAANGAWTFHVTVEHPDNGWEDYADGWDVVLPDGTVLKPDPGSPYTRILLHPHDNEQPFTRSQSDLKIPDDITQVTVRAHDNVDGFGGREVIVDLTVETGEDFEVVRE